MMIHDIAVVFSKYICIAVYSAVVLSILKVYLIYILDYIVVAVVETRPCYIILIRYDSSISKW